MTTATVEKQVKMMLWRFLRVFMATALTEVGIICSNEVTMSAVFTDFSWQKLLTLVLVPVIPGSISAAFKGLRETSNNELIRKLPL